MFQYQYVSGEWILWSREECLSGCEFKKWSFQCLPLCWEGFLKKTDANIFVGAGLIDNTGMLVITRTTVRAISETIARCLTMCLSRITDIRAKTLLPSTGGCLQSDK